ncbi:hypothetical protein Hanom_Chr05g00400451 [Helianthus anomalus]
MLHHPNVSNKKFSQTLNESKVSLTDQIKSLAKKEMGQKIVEMVFLMHTSSYMALFKKKYNYNFNKIKSLKTFWCSIIRTMILYHDSNMRMRSSCKFKLFNRNLQTFTPNRNPEFILHHRSFIEHRTPQNIHPRSHIFSQLSHFILSKIFNIFTQFRFL